MIRRQDCKPLFKIFSGEFLNSQQNIQKTFLGTKKIFCYSSKRNRFDIDNKKDLEILEIIAKKNYLRYKKFIHKL